MTVNAKSEYGTNDIRIHDYPTVDDGNDSFPEGGYQVTGSFADSDTRMILFHEISGAPLIQSLIDQGKAAYACAIAAPRSGYREVQQSSDARQILSWDPSNFGEPPYFTPMVVCTIQESRKLGSEDGIHPAWDGLKVTFPRGCRLAQGPVHHLMSSDLHRLIQIVADESITGQFRVEVADHDVFGFTVKCQPNLHRFLKSPGENKDKRRDIMIHVVSSCFQLLKQDYKDDDEDEGEGWRSHKSLVALSDRLDSAGYCNWSDSSFRPEVAATLLHGHDLPVVQDDD